MNSIVFGNQEELTSKHIVSPLSHLDLAVIEVLEAVKRKYMIQLDITLYLHLLVYNKCIRNGRQVNACL